MRYAAFLLILGFAAEMSGSSWAEPPSEVQKKQPPAKPLWNQTLPGYVVAISDKSISVRGIQAEFRGAAVQSVTERGRITSFNYYGKQFSFVTPTKTYQCFRAEGTKEGYTLFDDRDRVVAVIREADQPVREFTFCKALAEGGSGKTKRALMPAESYRVQDVKVGDYVAIGYDRIDGADICHLIQIVQRPGGLVPPSPAESDEYKVKYHERQNAYNEWVDHGTPIPDKFLAPWELEARRAKIAPMPRVVIPRIPEAQP